MRHRVAQPEGVHRDEDRPRGRAARRGRLGLEEVRKRAQGSFGDVGRRGEVTPTDVWDGFVAKVLSFVDEAALRPLRVVVDAANGMAGTMLPPVLARLPQLDVVECYFEPDGSFPNHEPNPLLLENRAFIVEQTRSLGADLGVAYDGDADRCFFVDDTGEFVPGDFVTALLAQAMLAKEPGRKVIYDVRASWAVPRAIEEAGGIPLVNRVGHAFIKHRMREEDALFAGEVSAHYYFRDFTQADTGVVPFLVMLELLSREGSDSRSCSPHSASATSSPARSTPRSRMSRRSSESWRSATGPREGASPTSTGSRSTSTSGTSMCARRTPSRFYG